MKLLLRIAVLVSLASSTAAFAQQPGSVEYNTVFLPAHGVGDTAGQSQKWGALARGADKTLGWYVGGDTEKEAVALAVQDCLARGSQDCEAVATFANKCAAVAVGPEVRQYVEAVDRLSAVKKDALKGCGSKECKILFEGCAYP